MAPLLRSRLHHVITCLLLQGSLIGFGLLMDRWFNPYPPCCTQDRVL
jgi:hypothetical protein